MQITDAIGDLLTFASIAIAIYRFDIRGEKNGKAFKKNNELF